MQECWKPINGFDGYEISNLGRARSFWTRVSALPRRGCKYELSNTPSYLKSSVHKQGYLKFEIYKDGKKYVRFVHRLVALAFIPNPDEKPEVNHENGVKADCCVGNLKWATRLENQRHATVSGLIRNWRRGPKTSLEVRQTIKDLFAQGLSKSHIARTVGVGRKCVLKFST